MFVEISKNIDLLNILERLHYLTNTFFWTLVHSAKVKKIWFSMTNLTMIFLFNIMTSPYLFYIYRKFSVPLIEKKKLPIGNPEVENSKYVHIQF